jgi:hypothetical protein
MAWLDDFQNVQKLLDAMCERQTLVKSVQQTTQKVDHKQKVDCQQKLGKWQQRSLHH